MPAPIVRSSELIGSGQIRPQELRVNLTNERGLMMVCLLPLVPFPHPNGSYAPRPVIGLPP